MQRQPVSSSNIASIGYESSSQTLEIEFHSGGVYEYYNVPEGVYTGLLTAGSHGVYFHEHIKEKYRFTKL